MDLLLNSLPIVNSMECIICAYPFDSTERLPALTVCDHNNICSFCFLRMRALQKNFNCPTCKRDLEHVICTDRKDALFSHFSIWGDNIGEDFILDQKSRMFLPKKYSKSKVEPLWLCKCNTCHQTRRDLKSLRGHLIADHNLQLCLLCAEHKQAFPSEQKIYTKSQYEKHLRQGDGDGGNGHPNCEFCRTRYYDSTALFVHLNKDHYSCHLCDKMGIKFKYYNNYPDLETHYRKDHFLCEERACLEKQFIAFSNEIDLAAHNMTWHPTLSINRTIHMNFKTHREDAKASANSSSGKGRRDDHEEGKETSEDATDRRTQRFEGGLGGRANEGEWQVELQPFLAGDPRDPTRNTNSTENAANYAADIAAAAAGGSTEEFPALSTVAPVGSFYQGISTSNKWLSIGGSNKSKKSDFPELKSNNNNSNSSNSSSGKKKGGGSSSASSALESKFKVTPASRAGVAGRLVGASSNSAASGSGAGGGAGHVSSIDADYAVQGGAGAGGAYVGAASSAATAGLGNWVTLKVDKRLSKAAGGKAGGGSEATAGATSGNKKKAGAVGGGGGPASEQETIDLALALSASMINSPTTTSGAGGGGKPSPYLSATQSDVSNSKISSSEEWTTVERAAAAAAAPLPPPPPDSTEAYPTLSTGSRSTVPQPPAAPVRTQQQQQQQKPLAPKKNTTEVSSMLKLAGVAGGAPSKTKASKLTVVKTLRSPSDAGKLSPTPGDSGKYTGWASIGGAPKNQPAVSAPASSALSTDEFPGLGGGGKKSK